jgi:hypothetical protein
MSTLDWTMTLPDHVLCTCGKRGKHEENGQCPAEGALLVPEEILATDTTMLRYRFEDDPVGMAMTIRIEELTWSLKALSVTKEWALARLREDYDRVNAMLSSARDTARSWEDRHEATLRDLKKAKHDLESLRAEVKEKDTAMLRYRAILEEVALRSGQFDEGTRISAWGPDKLMREYMIRTIVNDDEATR